MNNRLKKVTDVNFKANSELKVQYIFDDGYCYFLKSQAKQRAIETKKQFHTVERNAKAEKQEIENAEAIAEKEEAILEKKQLLLDAQGEEKIVLEEEILRLEEELDSLKQ